MKRVITIVCLLASAIASNAAAEPIKSVAANVDGKAVQNITWTDSAGKPRTVSVLGNNLRIIRYAYTVGSQNVVDDEVPNYGIGNMVNHGDCGATTTFGPPPEYKAEAALAGANHYVWRSTFRHEMCSHAGVRWRVTSEYVFFTGHDHFIQTVTYDSSDLPMGEEVGDDMRGPYNQTTWPGDGDITGFGWGSQYKFKTTGPIPDGNANVGGGVAAPWEWREPNTIPYVWEWCDPSKGAAVDREFGIVQNQPYDQQDFGGGFFGCGNDCFASAPPTMGSALPASWAMPSQMSSYDSAYRSGRITWGQTYGTFNNGHANDTGTIQDMGDHFRPINAWSWTHVVGAFTAGVVAARVRDTERAYASSISASTGEVVSEGPRGPGNFVGPSVGTMPTVTWSHPGFDFIYRSWNVAAANGVAEVELDVDGGLFRPVIVVHGLADASAKVQLDGKALVADSDYFVSRDEAGAKLWLTLASDLSAGKHALAIAGDGASLPTAGAGAPAAGRGGQGGMSGASGSSAGSGATAGGGGSAGASAGQGGASAGRGGAGQPSAGGGGTGGERDGGTDADAATGDAGDSDDEGCRAAGKRTTPLWAALALLPLYRRRRRAA